MTHLYAKVIQTATGRMLEPADRMSEDLLAKVKPGKLLMLQSKSARNPKQHRLLFVILGMIAENSDRFTNAKHVLYEIKMNTGQVIRTRIRVPELGVIEHTAPDSINYESMTKTEFEEWFSRALDYIETDIWPGVDRTLMRRQAAQKSGVDDWPQCSTAREEENA